MSVLNRMDLEPTTRARGTFRRIQDQMVGKVTFVMARTRFQRGSNRQEAGRKRSGRHAAATGDFWRARGSSIRSSAV
jgi:hypothetical protein